MWFVFFLDNVFPKPKGKITPPREIRKPDNFTGDLISGVLCLGVVVLSIAMVVMALF